MPIFVGTSDIDDITLGGSSKFHSVWKGSTRVWARPLIYNLTVGSNVPTSGLTIYGYSPSNGNIGSISFLSGHNSYTNDWFKNLASVSHSAYVYNLYFSDWSSSSGQNDQLYFVVGSTSTPSGAIPNNDTTFSRMTIDGNVYTRSSANYIYNTGSNFSTWFWDNQTTNPLGTTTGAVKKVRFDKP